MKDERYTILARNLINYSVSLKKGDKILIENFGHDTALARELIKEAYRVGGIPYFTMKGNEVLRTLLNGCDAGQIRETADFEIARMKEMQAYIGIRGGNNVSELGSVEPDKMNIYQKNYQTPLHSDLRVKKTRWCILRYPSNSMAQLAGMATEDFEDFYFKVCNLDYARMSKSMDGLVKAINRAEKVKIKGRGTDLTFSIKGMHAVKCDGIMNIPDGEVYTAPVRDSVNGYITYNTPAVYQGVTYDNIRFDFRDGKIIKAVSTDTERINKVLDIDEGARYIGEFSFGFNPYIEKPIKDTLFDEKIKGSIHFTPGRAYDECDNGNRSSIHWDLVYIQRPEYGGGEIWFDDTLIRKDGIFVPDELKCLNPENLI